MALNTQLSDATVNAQASALAALCNSGTIKVYDGSQPATADTALGAQVLGVTLTFGATAFGAPASGLLTSNAITSGTAGNAITPTWARIFQSNGTTVVMDISVGASGANMTLGAFTAGTVVSVSVGGFTHDVKNATANL